MKRQHSLIKYKNISLSHCKFMSETLQETFTNNNVHPQAAKAATELVRDGLSLAGMQAAMTYANPFPDKPIEPILMPTGAKNCIPAAPRCQFSITKPAGLTADANWGFAIIQHPIIKPLSSGITDQVVNYTTPGEQPTVIVPGASLTNLWSGFAFDDSVSQIDLVGQTASGGLSAALPGFTGFDITKIPGTVNLKVLSQGCEVENTTPELYKGGSVTIARFEPQSEDTQLVYSPNSDQLNVNWMTGWPYRFEDVTANPSAVSWGAEKGFYMPNNMRKDHDLKYMFPNFKFLFIGRTNPAIAQNPVRVIKGSFLDVGFGIKVAIFRGLHPMSTFLFNGIVYLATQQDSISQLFPISRSEPPTDAKYRQFLSELGEPMPVATVFKGNALGSWFNTVCDIVSNIGSTVGSILPGPIGTIASGIGAAAHWAGNFNAGYANDKSEEKVDYDRWDISATADEVEAGVTKLRDLPKAVRREVQEEIRLRRAERHAQASAGERRVTVPAARLLQLRKVQAHPGDVIRVTPKKLLTNAQKKKANMNKKKRRIAMRAGEAARAAIPPPIVKTAKPKQFNRRK